MIKKHIIFAILTIITAATVSLAGVNDYYGKTITAIRLSETAAVDSFLIFNSSGLVSGEILTAGKLQDAIKKIYALGIFSDVAIEGELSSGGVELLIEIVSYQRVSKIDFKGNNKIKDKTLTKEITISEGRIVSPGTIKSNVERIKKLYEDKGYLMVSIESDVEPDPDYPDKAILTFRIVEGRKVKVRDITFIDNNEFTDDKLRSKMSTKKNSFFRSGTFDREKYREDKQKIIDFYKNEGFIDVVITADSIIYADAERMKYSIFAGTTYVAVPDLFLKIYIDEGERYYFGKFSWEGNTIYSDKKIGSVFKIKEGQKYNQGKYSDMLFKLYELYQDEGYWYVQIDEKKTPRDKTLDTHFYITENQPVYVRMINIEGNTKTLDKVIRRELKIKPNTIFKRSVLGRSLREVMMLNFFANVTPDWTILDNGNIDLIVNVEEKPTGQFNVGAGYSARDNLVGTLGIGWPNFLGGGQTLTFDSDFGKKRNTFSVSYFDPWFLDTPILLGISIYHQERETYDWFTEQRRGGSLRLGRRLRWPDNYFKVFTRYRVEEVKYYSISQGYINANALYAYSVDKINWPLISSVFSLTVERDSRNLSMFATKGSSVFWIGELAGTFLQGDWDYWKQTFGFEYYYTPFWKLTFGLRGKFGIMDGIYGGDSDRSIPYSERFTPGGTDPDGIIRGYEDSRIGPTTESGGYVGGRSLVVYNLELTIPIVEQQFYSLLFADAGNAYKTGDELKDNIYRNFYRSVGFGFRVVAPMIGVIGFDFGIPLDIPPGGTADDRYNLRPHFQIGRGF